VDLEFCSLQDEVALTCLFCWSYYSMILARPGVYHCIVLTPVFALSGEVLIPYTDCQSQKRHCVSFWNDDTASVCLVRHCELHLHDYEDSHFSLFRC
jgi:hypothetical protein